jgi:hypothetical protein
MTYTLKGLESRSNHVPFQSFSSRKNVNPVRPIKALLMSAPWVVGISGLRFPSPLLPTSLLALYEPRLRQSKTVFINSTSLHIPKWLSLLPAVAAPAKSVYARKRQPAAAARPRRWPARASALPPRTRSRALVAHAVSDLILYLKSPPRKLAVDFEA